MSFGWLIVLILIEFFFFTVVVLYKRLYLRPIVMYVAFLFLYPIVSSLIFYLNLNFLYEWVPYYPQEIYVKALKISIASMLPLCFIPVFMKKSTVTASFKPTVGFGIIKNIFFLIFGLYFVFVLINFNTLFLGWYGTIKAGAFFKLLTLLDYLFYSAFVYRMAYLPSQKFSKAEYGALGFYALVKIGSGGRMFLLVFVLAYLVHFVKQNGDKVLSLSKFIPVSLFTIFGLGFIVSIRERTFDVAKSFYSLSLEFLNCYISALKTASLSEDFIGTNYTFFLDPILSFIPSGIFDRENFYFFRFLDSIGGYYAYSPIGGQYLPHQIFLIHPSYVFVFIYFLVLAILLYHMDRMTFSSNRFIKYNYVYSLLIFLQSLFLVFSVRHYFFAHVKHFLIVIVFGVLINIGLNLITRGTGRKPSNRIL